MIFMNLMIFIVYHSPVNDIHYLLFHSFLSPTGNINVIHSLNDIQCLYEEMYF